MIFILVDFFLLFFFTFFDGVILKIEEHKMAHRQSNQKKIAKSWRQRRDIDISIKKTTTTTTKQPHR